jgi:hypothetical protein
MDGKLTARRRVDISHAILLTISLSSLPSNVMVLLAILVQVVLRFNLPGIIQDSLPMRTQLDTAEVEPIWSRRPYSAVVPVSKPDRHSPG